MKNQSLEVAADPNPDQEEGRGDAGPGRDTDPGEDVDPERDIDPGGDAGLGRNPDPEGDTGVGKDVGMKGEVTKSFQNVGLSNLNARLQNTRGHADPDPDGYSNPRGNTDPEGR